MLSLTMIALVAILQLTQALNLDISSPSSIRNASSALAFNLMSYYKNNQTGVPPENVGMLPQPLYWWQAGAMWGGLVDYSSYTNDTSYVPTITQALQAQVGPDDNYMPPAYFSSLGNDDQAFWALAVLSAAEYDFQSPTPDLPQWLALAEAVFNTQWPRWDTMSCEGGLKWQVFESNKGYNYKNTVSNGAFFQIAARLARYTGNQTYVEWANRAWDWMNATHLFDDNYNVFDGSDDTINCTEVDHTAWSYNPALLVYGTANLYNYTNGSAIWQERTDGLLRATIRNFYDMENATNVLFEQACEPYGTCNNDQYSFKAYASRYLAKTAVLAPYILPAIRTLLMTSANAVAQACSSGADRATCGQKWYVGGFDGNPGIGQQMSALEAVQALLVLPQSAANGSASEPGLVPRTGPNVTIAALPVTSTFVAETPTSTADGPPGPPGQPVNDHSGGSGGGSGQKEGAACPAKRSVKGVKVALPVVAAAVAEAGALV